MAGVALVGSVSISLHSMTITPYSRLTQMARRRIFRRRSIQPAHLIGVITAKSSPVVTGLPVAMVIGGPVTPSASILAALTGPRPIFRDVSLEEFDSAETVAAEKSGDPQNLKSTF